MNDLTAMECEQVSGGNLMYIAALMTAGYLAYGLSQVASGDSTSYGYPVYGEP
jgi:hypothetical protein